MIMVCSLRRDIIRYNSNVISKDTLAQTGWILVHGDVFRPPDMPEMIVHVVGEGVRMFFTILITIRK